MPVAVLCRSILSISLFNGANWTRNCASLEGPRFREKQPSFLSKRETPNNSPGFDSLDSGVLEETQTFEFGNSSYLLLPPLRIQAALFKNRFERFNRENDHSEEY